MNYKQELIKRYEYLYENISYIFGPYVHRQSIINFLGDKIKHNNSGKKPIVTLYTFDNDMLRLVEEFLFSDTVMEEIPFYVDLEIKKKDIKFLKNVKQKFCLMEKYNTEFLNIQFDMWNLLEQVHEYIVDQSDGYQNKKLKLDALDEYFRIWRYTNDGRVWTSGYDLNVHDIRQMDDFVMVMSKHDRLYLCGSSGFGIISTNFIYYLASVDNKRHDNKSILSEKEKQDIYLKFHDEIPWDFMNYEKKSKYYK